MNATVRTRLLTRPICRGTLLEGGYAATVLFTWNEVPWFGLDADDNPLVMGDRSVRDLYALDWEPP